MSFLGLAVLSAASLARRKERVDAGEAEPLLTDEQKARARRRVKDLLGPDDISYDPAECLGYFELGTLYGDVVQCIGLDPYDLPNDPELRQYVSDLVDVALYGTTQDAQDFGLHDLGDYEIAGRAGRERRAQRRTAKQQRQAQRQSARAGRQGRRQDRRAQRPERRAGRQERRTERQAQRQDARAGRQASRQEWRQGAGENFREGLSRAGELAKYALNPAKPLTDALLDKMQAKRDARALEAQQQLDAMDADFARGQELEDAYHEGDLAAAYGPEDYPEESAPPPPSDPGGGGGGAPDFEGIDAGGSFDEGNDFDDFDDFDDGDDLGDFEEEEGIDDFEEKEDLEDLDEEDFEDAEDLAWSDDEDIEAMSVQADPGVLIEAARAAVKLVSRLVKARREQIEAGEEPVITATDIRAAKDRAVRRIAAAKRAERKADTAIGADRARGARDVRRPSEGDAPHGPRGAVLWTGAHPRRRPASRVAGVSLLDSGVDPSKRVQIALDPTTMAEAAELLLAITKINVAQLQDGARPVSEGIESGEIVYGRPDVTTFATIRDVWQSGVADCAPLSAAIAAERTVAGHPSAPYLYYSAPGVIHAVVRDLRTGDLYDPSRAAGMGGES